MFFFLPLAATTTEDPLIFLLNFGTLGVVFVLLLTGFLFTKPYVQRLEKEIEVKDRLLETLGTQLSMHTLPALARTAKVMEAVPSVEAALIEEIRRLRVDLSASREGGK